MDCVRCQSPNRAGRRFCGECGAPLLAECPACGFGNEATERFCGGCGIGFGKTSAGTGLAARAGESERRQVTVLFADVVGFTSLSERLDPEIVHELMDGCLVILSREVSRYGGRISAFTGDGVMALFGAPLAEEDHAVRAIHAALAIQAALPAYGGEVERRLGIEFKMRVGVNSGLVIAGGLEGGETAEYTALGDTVNLAARLESAARPGGVLAGESTRRAAGDAFRWAEVGPFQLKGKSEPVPGWEPVSAGEGQSRFEQLAQRGLTEFVGRTSELHALLAAWAQAATGEGQIVSIVGEAGLGKSRLVHEFKTEMAKREVPLVEGSCFTYGEGISYLPFIEILRGLLGVDLTTGLDAVKAVLDSRLASVNLEAAAPYLRHLLGADPGDERFALQSPGTVRLRTIEALQGVVLAAAGNEPTAVVVEDVHWIDQASQEVLCALVEAMATTSLLVVLVYRPEYLHAWGDVAYHCELALDRLGGASSASMVRAILGKSYASSLPLQGLSSDDSRSLVRELLGTPSLPAELEALIETYTDGNPLFIEELTRELTESGHLVWQTQGYALTSSPEGWSLPTTVQGVLLARIDRLNAELRGLLQIASVLGRLFPYRLLQAVAKVDGGLDRALLQLEDLDFVYQSALAPERQYSFKHVLTQEAVYQTLVRARRAVHHERAGQAIEALYADGLDEWVELLAHHYSRSDRHDKALDYLALAHQKALNSCAVVEADRFFNEAMGLLDRTPVTPDAEHRRIWFLVNQFFVAYWLNELPAYFEWLARYEDLGKRITDPVLRGHFYGTLARSDNGAGRIDEALRRFPVAAETCAAGGDIAGAGAAYAFAAWAHLMAGNYDDVIAAEARALEAFQEQFDPLNYMFARTAATWANVQRGAWAEAIAEGEEALRIGEAHGNDSLVCFSAFSLSMAYTAKGQLEQGLRYGELACGIAPTPAEKMWAGVTLAHAWCRTGQAGRAVAALEPALPLCDVSGFVMVQLWHGTCLGEAYFRTGQLKEATERLEAVVELAERTGFRYWLGSGLRFLGETVRQADPTSAGAKAASYFKRSMAVLSEIGAENELAHADAGYGRLCRDGGDLDEARLHLQMAVETFERLGTLGEG